MTRKFTRAEFLRRFLKPVSAAVSSEDEEPDYLCMLPPEFTDSMLREETLRLGGDPGKLDKNQMAALVLAAMANPTPQDR